MPSKKIDLIKRIEIEKTSSMLNWYNSDLNNDIPTPDTLIYELTSEELKMSYNWVDNGEYKSKTELTEEIHNLRQYTKGGSE